MMNQNNNQLELIFPNKDISFKRKTVKDKPQVETHPYLGLFGGLNYLNIVTALYIVARDTF